MVLLLLVDFAATRFKWCWASSSASSSSNAAADDAFLSTLPLTPCAGIRGGRSRLDERRSSARRESSAFRHGKCEQAV